MSKVNHRVSQALKGIMEFTDAFEAKQQAPKFVFPSKDSLNCEKNVPDKALGQIMACVHALKSFDYGDFPEYSESCHD